MCLACADYLCKSLCSLTWHQSYMRFTVAFIYNVKGEHCDLYVLNQVKSWMFGKF